MKDVGQKPAHILIHFDTDHISGEAHKQFAKAFKIMALTIDSEIRSSAEKSVALRKLLEARDNTMRAIDEAVAYNAAE